METKHAASNARLGLANASILMAMKSNSPPTQNDENDPNSSRDSNQGSEVEQPQTGSLNDENQSSDELPEVDFFSAIYRGSYYSTYRTH